ncbi:YqaE/Pmp3 family membrane protein [Rhodopila sp.]|uniref:YqaE/Pmp3 family membrane protein n=1 Tax=Rhodopila sp. TaxID=2480087 RepID=UPI003D09D54E
MIVIAVVVPFLALLLDGHIFQAAFCLGLQLTVIGWIPAAIWAIIVVKRNAEDRRYRELVSRTRR